MLMNSTLQIYLLVLLLIVDLMFEFSYSQATFLFPTTDWPQ